MVEMSRSLQLQAERGDARAQLAMAMALLQTRDGVPDLAEAQRFLHAACDQQNAEALLQHAALLAIGLFGERNLEEAFNLVSRAAAAGSERAKGQLAILQRADGKFNVDVWRAAPDVSQVSAAPRIFVIKNFLPAPACAWLISQKKDDQKAAEVIGIVNGDSVEDPVRTNSSAAFDILSDDLVLQLTRLRIAAAVRAPILHQEPTNLLRYVGGEEYGPHYDFIHGLEEAVLAKEFEAFGQRVGTFLIYLNASYEGGEIEFPYLNWRFKGDAGDALFFWSVSKAGTLERDALHAGLPVKKGEKWLLSTWLRDKPGPLW